MSMDEVWDYYSVDHPSFLTHTQMKRLFEYCLDFAISKETVEVFVESMDKGMHERVIKKNVYYSFLYRGKKLSNGLKGGKRKEFSSRSPHHKILLKFFDMANAMEDLKVNETEKQTIETKETVISKLKSKKIKENYDKTAKSQFEKDIINLKEK